MVHDSINSILSLRFFNYKSTKPQSSDTISPNFSKLVWHQIILINTIILILIVVNNLGKCSG